MLHLGAAMKVERTHAIGSLGKHTSEKLDTQRMSGRFPTPVSTLSINGSERTLFSSAQWWDGRKRAVNSFMEMNIQEPATPEARSFTPEVEKQAQFPITFWDLSIKSHASKWEERDFVTNQEQAQALRLSLYSCSLMASQEDQGPDWVRRSYLWSFFSFIFHSQSLL